MDKQDIVFLSATELSQLIREKQLSPVEAVEAYLERIGRLNSRYNAYLTVCHEEALLAARKAEKAIVAGRYRGPMHGIPMAVKDQILTKGVRTTGGSPILNNFIPNEDAGVMGKLKAAGAILLGKLNMSEFATALAPHRFGIARNPWDLERETGRSSSGSGSATAAFLCATSLAEDTGGSVRFPASWCGLVGLRPSWGRVSRYGLMPGVWSMDTIGPISRSVKDCAMTLQGIAGYDPKDPYTWNWPVPDYPRALNGRIKGIRVGVMNELLYADVVDPQVQSAVAKAIDVLRQLGAAVQEVSMPLARQAWAISGVLLAVESAMTYRELLRDRLQELGVGNRVGYLTGSLVPTQTYYKAQKLRSLLRQQILKAYETVDVLVQPTNAVAAQKAVPDSIPGTRVKTTNLARSITAHFSLANTPALSIPCGFTSDNLPIALQIGGRPFEEETVLNVAYAFEQNTDWHDRRPPV